jgi:hypothetical protein
LNRTCIIVSPYFPPSTLAGVHRARHLAKHLPAAGWTPIVLCVDEAYHEERLDRLLAALIPTSLEVVRVSALSPGICRPLGLGEISLRAWWPLRRALFRLLATRPVGAVLITGSPYYPMLLTAEIKRRFGVPVVLDFQDPWVSAWSAMQPRLSKSGVAHQLSVLLESKVVRAADFITSVSETQNAEMTGRYPWLDRSKMAAIPIGGDPDDYQTLRSTPVGSSGFALEPGYFHLSYVGTIWPPVAETVRTLLQAVAWLKAQKPVLYPRLRLNFVGTTANPNHTVGYRVLPLAQAEGVDDIVREVPQRLPYLEALSIQANSDAVLVLGSDEPHYTASKIFGVLMSGRPYLSMFHQASQAHAFVVRAGGGMALGFAGKAGLPTLVSPLADAIVRLATATPPIEPPRREVYAPFEASAIAAQYAAIFERQSARQEAAA